MRSSAGAARYSSLGLLRHVGEKSRVFLATHNFELCYWWKDLTPELALHFKPKPEVETLGAGKIVPDRATTSRALASVGSSFKLRGALPHACRQLAPDAEKQSDYWNVVFVCLHD
jgi:hypothetical protein